MLRILRDVVRMLRYEVGLGPRVDVFITEKFERIRQHYVSPILDFGAGTCHLSRYLQSRGHQVTAVDIVSKSECPDVQLQVVPGPKLPFVTGAFDTSVAHFVLHHVQRQDEVFAELIRVTSGTLVISEDVVDSWWDQLIGWLHMGTSPWSRAWSGFRSTRGWVDFFARFPVDIVELIVTPRWRTPHYPVRRVIFVLRRRLAST